jgi:AcrR family transcriptional regulator
MGRRGGIARAAEVAEGTIFHLFGSKRELLVAVGDAYGQGMVEAAFGATAPTSRLDDVPSIIHRIFDYVARSSGPLVAFLLASDPAEGALAQAANRTRMLDAIEAVVRRGMARGEISRRDPRVAAALQFGVVESALRDCFLYHAGRDREQYAQETIRCLVAYLRA